MGQNLILNVADHGFTVCAFNRTVTKVDRFLENEAQGVLSYTPYRLIYGNSLLTLSLQAIRKLLARIPWRSSAKNSKSLGALCYLLWPVSLSTISSKP